MRTVKEPEVRKQEILEGAIRVFAEKGYDKATISVIAKELKISQGLCYRYFASKEEIYEAAIEKYADLILMEFLKHQNKTGTLRERLEHIGESIVHLMKVEQSDMTLYSFFHEKGNERLHNELLLKVAEKLLPYIQEILRQGKERGEISVADPDRTAIIGLYGEMGTFFVKDMPEEVRVATIQMAWKRLLDQ